MRLKETIEELKEVKKYFEDMTGGSCPMCSARFTVTSGADLPVIWDLQ